MSTSETAVQSDSFTQTKAAIRGFLGRFFPVAQMSDTDDIFQNGFINSLFAQQLIVFLEREFAIEIPDEDLERRNFQSVSATAALVERLKAENLKPGGEARHDH